MRVCSVCGYQGWSDVVRLRGEQYCDLCYSLRNAGGANSTEHVLSAYEVAVRYCLGGENESSYADARPR